ncbi:MAG: hypothetical protein OHK0013_32650 [Sandaracinaceae bacterium]
MARADVIAATSRSVVALLALVFIALVFVALVFFRPFVALICFPVVPFAVFFMVPSDLVMCLTDTSCV